MYVTPNMGLKAWDLETDPYSHTDLVNNAIVIDKHNHTPGLGAPLTIDSIPVLDSSKLGPCSVTRVQICDGEVINSKLASPAVKANNLFDDSVTQAKIADNAVGSDQIAPNAVGPSELQDGSVGSSKLVDASVTNQKIGDNAVNEAKLATGAVTYSKIAANSVDGLKIQDGSVGNAELASPSVTSNKIGDGAVLPQHMARVPAAFVTIDHEHVVADGEFHVIQWDNQRYDTVDPAFGGVWDPAHRGYLFVPYDGIYLITASVMWEEGGANAGVSGRLARIRHNNTPITGDGPKTPLRDDPSAPFRCRHSLAATFSCVAGDQLDVLVRQTSGSNQRVVPDGFNSNFAMTWIAPLP